MLTFKDYQEKTKNTDQRAEKKKEIYHYLIPLLGLFGEIGTVAAEYKKRLRDKQSYKGYRKKLSEELGDVLWYIATIANDMNLSLEEIANNNLNKTTDRWSKSNQFQNIQFYDEEYNVNEQLPRNFLVSFTTDYNKKVYMTVDGSHIGNSLSDNSHIEDGYRFHDIFHLAFVAYLGWSPVIRALMKKKRKSNIAVDEVEDGARACIIEEAIAALSYNYATEHNFFEGIDSIDYEFIKTIKSMVKNLEVNNAPSILWEHAIINGSRVFQKIRSTGSGLVKVDLDNRSISIIE